MLGEPLAEHPEAVAQQLAANVDAKGEGIVILVDQLEEIVTRYDAKDAKAEKGRLDALDLLSRLAEAPVGLRVIVAARRDMLDDVLAVDPHFSRALSRGTQQLSPVSSAGWEEVLDRSLEAYGYRFEDDELRSEVLADLKGREAAMPLAQFGLTRLWAARDEKKKTIPRAAFSAKGGMRGALEQHADATIAALKIPRETLRDVLLAMTTPEGTRAHVELDVLVERFGEPAKEAIFALTKARLVVAEKAGFTFVHDSILREWSLVRGWIEDARDDRLLVAHIERDAARWIESRDVAELWRKGRLAAALELWKRGSVPLSDAAREFLTASASDEQKAQRIRWGVGILSRDAHRGRLALLREGEQRPRRAGAQGRGRARRGARGGEDARSSKPRRTRAKPRRARRSSPTCRRRWRRSGRSTARACKRHSRRSRARRASTARRRRARISRRRAPRRTRSCLSRRISSGLSGPNIPKPSDSGPSAAEARFDQGAIERVVNSRKAGVKRTCLDRGGSAAGEHEGHGDDHDRAERLGPEREHRRATTRWSRKCIEQQLRSWSFPAPGEVKQVQIPFVFVRQ